jgi:pyruvate formate lyase activating enzyme
LISGAGPPIRLRPPLSKAMPSRVAYIKTSLIDFPGRIASVLFLPGCNFRCPYCQNAALVEPDRLGARRGAGDGLAPMGEFLEFLDRRKSLVSGVVISGGEPLLHAETPRLAKAIRGRGLAVKLDTNGSFPSRIAEVGADYVALDFKTAPSAYGRVAPGPAVGEAGGLVLESLAVLRSSGVPFEIRITCAPGILGAPELEEMSLALEAGDEVALQGFRPGGCLDPAFDAVEPYTRGEMEGLLEIVRHRAPRSRIRGV